MSLLIKPSEIYLKDNEGNYSYSMNTVVEQSAEEIIERLDDYASQIPETPVKSVNGQTGDVVVSSPTKVSELENDSGYLTEDSSTITELKTSVSSGKALVAEAVTGKGVQTASDASFATIATNIDSIVTDPSVGDTVTSGSQILSGYTAHSNGVKYTGSIGNFSDLPNNPNGHLLATNMSVGVYTSGDTTNYTYFQITDSKGRYNNNTDWARYPTATVRANVNTGANIGAAQVLSGYSGWNGNSLVAGSMTNRGAWTGATTGSGNVAIPAGYHNGSGYISGKGAYDAGRASVTPSVAKTGSVTLSSASTSLSITGVAGTPTSIVLYMGALALNLNYTRFGICKNSSGQWIWFSGNGGSGYNWLYNQGNASVSLSGTTLTITLTSAQYYGATSWSAGTYYYAIG